MCGRSRCTLQPVDAARRAKVPAEAIKRRRRYKARHNCFPGCNVPVVFDRSAARLPGRVEAELDADAGDTPHDAAGLASGSSSAHPARVLVPMQWGLVPSFTASAAKPDFWKAFNARSETVASKAMFRRLVDSRRCAVLLDGFYEWSVDAKGEKQPYYVHAGDGPLVVAGLFDLWRHRRPAREGEETEAAPASGGWVEEDVWTVTMLTRDAAPSFAWLHDRMPVLLQEDEALDAWLGAETFAEVAGSEAFRRASAGDRPAELTWRPVSKQMNSVKFEDPSASEAVDLEAERRREEKQQITRFFGAAASEPEAPRATKRPRDADGGEAPLSKRQGTPPRKSAFRPLVKPARASPSKQGRASPARRAKAAAPARGQKTMGAFFGAV